MKTAMLRRDAGLSRWTSVAFVLLLVGCATAPVGHHPPSLDEWLNPSEMTVVRPSSPVTPVPPEVTPAGPEPVPLQRLAQPELPTNVITDLQLTDEAEVATILRTLAKAADLNMLVSPRVEGRMNFAFQNVPWDQAFRSVIQSAGLTYAWEGGVLRVLTLDDLKRGLDVETLLRDREDVRAEKRRLEPLMVQVIPVKYAKARTVGATVKALLASLTVQDAGAEKMLSRSSVTVDEESNTIVVHAIAEDVEKAVALVARLDRVKPQVHLEARIVEATRDTARQLGVQWGGAVAQVNDGRMVVAGGRGETRAGYNSDFGATFAQPTELAAVGFSMGLVSEKIGGSELLAMQLTALQSKGRIQILSSPSITTLDNEPAVIESGEERAYRKTTGTGNEADVTVEWKKAVLKLEVTPHVVDGDYLRVDIVANKDSFDDTKQEANGEVPVNTKHARTTVLLRNGETVVIGGLSVEGRSQAESGIPYLMDIPGLGYLFKNWGQTRKFDETLIFITPKILAAK